MKSARFWTTITASILVTPVALLMALFSAGAGHGSYSIAKILFPYTMLSAFPITEPFMVLAVIQFPIYGLILAFSVKSERFSST